MDRAEEIAQAGRRVRGVLEEKHRAREVTLARVALDDPVLRRVDPGDPARGVRAGRGARGARPPRTWRGPTRRWPPISTSATAATSTTPKKEYAEARITLAFVRGDPLPMPDALGVEPPAYLNGLAEAASELRRHILDCLRADQLERAEMLLGTMDDVYGLLVTVDYPDAVTGGLRRTTDALRAVIERTRGDLTERARRGAAARRDRSVRRPPAA